MNRFLAIPGALLALALASPAAVAAPDAGAQTICANGGAGLCVWNNTEAGSSAEVVAFNQNQIEDYEYTFVSEGTTLHSQSGGIGYPFNTAALNNSVSAGRPVWELEATTECLDVNDLHADINSCSGSQSYWVASGSGRMISVGISNVEGSLQFMKSDGVSESLPDFVVNPNQTCPGACWSGF